MGHLLIISGKTDKAEKLLQQALALFPGYHYALGNLAKVRIQQKRYDQAVDLLQQRYKAAPPAENLYDLAEAWSGRDAARQPRKPLPNSRPSLCSNPCEQTIPTGS